MIGSSLSKKKLCDCRPNLDREIKEGAQDYYISIQENIKFCEFKSVRIVDSIKKSKVIEDDLKFLKENPSVFYFQHPDSLKILLNNLKQNPKLDFIDHKIIEIKFMAADRLGECDETRMALIRYSQEAKTDFLVPEHFDVEGEFILRKGIWKRIERKYTTVEK
jgi:hypothetical protein